MSAKACGWSRREPTRLSERQGTPTPVATSPKGDSAMSPDNISQLKSLEGRQVGVALTDGSMIS